MEHLTRENKITQAAVLIYGVERNWQVFTQTRMQPEEVIRLIKEDMALRHLACGKPVVQPNRALCTRVEWE
jgi:hypothetical protein